MAVVINGNGAVTGLTALPDSAMATGSVVQTVFGSTTTRVINTDGNYMDSGVTATITPSSSSNKIMVIASMQWMLIRDSTETDGNFKLLRDSTAISTHTGAVHTEADTTSQGRILAEGGYTIQVLDSPSTTSAITYKVQIATNRTANNAKMEVSRSDAPSCITLLEVVA